MTITANPSVRQVLTTVAVDPRYPGIARKRLISWPHLVVVAVAYGVFIGASWAFLAGNLPFLVMLPLNMFAIFASFTPMHDAMHRSVSSNERVGNAIGALSIFLLVPGLTTVPFRTLHMEHHRWTGDREKDPDVPLVETRKRYLLAVLMFPEYLWIKFYLGKLARNRPRNEVVVFVASIVVYLGVHIGFLLSPWAWQFTLCWLIPQKLGMVVLIYAFGHIQHPENADWESSPFQATVVVRTSPATKVFWLGQTDHCIHHAFPHIPFHRYHKIWELGDSILRRQGIPERTVFRKPREIQWPRAPYETTQRARVLEAADVGSEVRTYVLAAVDGQLPPFAAGSHIDVHLPSGRVRQYSLCSAPGEDYRIAVRRESNGRGGSAEVHDVLRVGMELTISEPRNNFALNGAARHVLIAGGIGITPLLSMAHQLRADARDFDLHVCARDADSVPFGAVLGELPFADRVHVHLDAASGRSSLPAADVLGRWDGSAALYLCGPVGFMDWVAQQAVGLGWPGEVIHRESFTAPVYDIRDNAPFEVVLARSGITLAVPADRQILDVLIEHEVPIMWGCSQGVCGTCVTTVLDGEPEHRDAVLSPAARAANTAMCVCVSRASCPRLVLDL
jgi:ferredoxin-NADP reductase/fatty acid desaturase